MTKPKYYELRYPYSPIGVRLFKSYGGGTYELGYHGWEYFQPYSMEDIKKDSSDMIARAIFEINKTKLEEYLEKVEAYKVMEELIV